MKKINRRSFLAAAGLTAAALALTACGGSASSTASSTASSAASSEAASTSAAAELTTVEAGKLTMATNAAFPPYEMTTDAGEFEGIDIDTAKAIAEKLGLELQIDDMDFDAALLSVQQGKADIVMAGVTVTDERKAVMDFSDSYATGIQSIIVPEGSDIASPDDLAGKKIGTQRGTTGYIYCSDDCSACCFHTATHAYCKSLCKIFDCFFIQPCLFAIRTCHSLRTVITTHFSLNCLFYF